MINSILLAGMGMGHPKDPCGRFPFPPCPIPLDDYIWILVLAGVLIVIWREQKQFIKTTKIKKP